MSRRQYYSTEQLSSFRATLYRIIKQTSRRNNRSSVFSTTEKISQPFSRSSTKAGSSTLLLQIKQIHGNYIHKIFRRAGAIPSNSLSSFFRYNQRKWIWIESHCGGGRYHYDDAAERSLDGPAVESSSKLEGPWQGKRWAEKRRQKRTE